MSGQEERQGIRWFDIASLGLFVCAAVGLWAGGDAITTYLFSDNGAIIAGMDLYARAQFIVLSLGTIILGCGIALVIVLLRQRPVQDEQPVQPDGSTDLMLSGEQFRMLYDHGPVPYFLIDDVGNIRNPNKATLRFFGGVVEECEQANFFSLITGAGADAQALSLFKTKVAYAMPVTGQEMQLRTLQGTERWALVSIFSLGRQSTLSFRHLVALVDVTKEKESEEVKTDFLLLASHQLRTPTTTIKWYADYLLNASSVELSPIVREYLEEIFAGSERMTDLLTTLLTVSRIEMGTLAPEFVRVQIAELIEDILTELRPDIKKKDHTVDVRVAGTPDAVVTDRVMVRIVIHNLLTNAIKYTPQNGTITIITTYSSNRCVISVADNGYGIPMQEQEKIFSKLFRASNARRISVNGTGLGLYLTKSFMEKLGGSVEFVSEPDHGTTFMVSLPRVAPGA